MNITLFLQALTPAELAELKQVLPTIKPSNSIPVYIDDLTKFPISIRLFNALESYMKKYPFISDLTKERFLKMPNAGVNSWRELTELLNSFK